MVKAKYLSGL